VAELVQLSEDAVAQLRSTVVESDGDAHAESVCDRRIPALRHVQVPLEALVRGGEIRDDPHRGT
jgi:hypothetical protein